MRPHYDTNYEAYACPQCWDLIQVLRKKKNEVNADFNQKYQEYIKLDKNYNNYMRSVKRKE